MKNKIILILLAGALGNITCRVDAAAAPGATQQALKAAIQAADLNKVKAIVPDHVNAEEHLVPENKTAIQLALAQASVFEELITKLKESVTKEMSIVQYLQSTLPKAVLETRTRLLDPIKANDCIQLDKVLKAIQKEGGHISETMLEDALATYNDVKHALITEFKLPSNEPKELQSRGISATHINEIYHTLHTFALKNGYKPFSEVNNEELELEPEPDRRHRNFEKELEAKNALFMRWRSSK